jgi:L-2-hydroxyglutarate oxidase LhgO
VKSVNRRAEWRKGILIGLFVTKKEKISVREKLQKSASHFSSQNSSHLHGIKIYQPGINGTTSNFPLTWTAMI